MFGTIISFVKKESNERARSQEKGKFECEKGEYGMKERVIERESMSTEWKIEAVASN